MTTTVSPPTPAGQWSKVRNELQQLWHTELRDSNIRSAYVVCGMTGTAYGMVTAVVAVYLNKVRDIDTATIGVLAMFFAAGIALFSVPMGKAIQRFAPRMVLSLGLLGYAAATAIFPFLATLFGLGAARGFDGAFSVGVWVSLETVLLMRTTTMHRGLITSLYTISMATGYAVGAVLGWIVMLLYPMPMVFVTAGMFASLAALIAYVFLDREIHPIAGSGHGHEPTSSELDAPTASEHRPPILSLYWKIKTACIPTFCYGYFQASLVLFLPLFLINVREVKEEDTGLLVASFSIGMAASVVFVGRLGDRYGHLKTVRTLVGLGVVLTASLVYLPTYALVAVAVLLAGASLAPIWPMSLALQSLIVDPRDYSRSNALLNGSYGLGTLVGPLVSGYLFKHHGGETMFLHIAGLWALALVATLAFRRDDPSFRAIAHARARATV
ncbi:MFS transporter [Nannocystis radixulma]|uniref:MFS transporter n=1 Tax=Nannocystis radixulma TaxID=2995305 RepID=A0ABT5BJS7_9BACT|nr:MFS transporter [Nannocystis radixulma]MDC0673855.1 MFS transporter [Nannocystis radixulma]